MSLDWLGRANCHGSGAGWTTGASFTQRWGSLSGTATACSGRTEAGGIEVEARGFGSCDNVGSLRDLKVTGKPAGKWHHAVRAPLRTGPDGVAVERGAE